MPHKEDSAALGSVSTTISYHSPEGYPNGKKEIFLGTAGEKLRKHDLRPTTVTDMRTCDEEITLDRQGFQHVVSPTSLKYDDVSDYSYVKANYWLETQELLKRVTGARNVVPMAHVVRRSTWDEVMEEAERVKREQGEKGLCKRMNPARSAHCDQSDWGAELALRTIFSKEEAEKLMKKRWGIINVWRPLKPVHRDPLAVCDYRTVSPSEDLVGVDLIVPMPENRKDIHPNRSDDRITINRWDVKYNPKHRWYYVSNMQPDECLLLKIFDSKRDGRARCCPHTAIATEVDEGPARESIELRTLVFWDEEPAE